jgi:hypothetical protein
VSLLTTVVEVTGYLDQAQIEFLIGGSLASSLWGQERTTHDADIAALISVQQFDILEGLIKWPYVIDANDMRASIPPATDFIAGQILHGETLDKIDLFILPDGEYTEAQMQNRRYVEVAPGHSLPFSSPEDIIITKLRLFVLGNRISDRQWNDIVQVLEMQAGQLDDPYLEKWANHFGLFDLLQEAKKQTL